ncbi:glycyl-radical enzyme activating protein [Chloroflexota bacterium]
MTSTVPILMQGKITHIQRFSIDDGPGIRTTVFLKGCSLNCIWCHNPECIHPDIQIQFFADRCTHCAACVQACSIGAQKIIGGQRAYLRELCQGMGECIKVCDFDALEKVGNDISADEAFQEINKDRVFYEQSEGGVTISGGEPLLQPDFTQAILNRCKQSCFHTAVDTAGHVPWNHFEKILPYTDLFLYDLKCINPEKHRSVTGSSNHLILENLSRLLQENKEIWVRIPLIPFINDQDEDILDFCTILSSMGQIQKIQLIPYHLLGVGKYASLDIPYQLMDAAPISSEKIEYVVDLFLKQGIHVEY